VSGDSYSIVVRTHLHKSLNYNQSLIRSPLTESSDSSAQVITGHGINFRPGDDSHRVVVMTIRKMRLILLVGLLGVLCCKSSIQGHESYDSSECGGALRADLRLLTANSDACKTDEDCTTESFDCPFGCFTALGRKYVPSARAIVKKYREQCPDRCAYNCRECRLVIYCRDGICSAECKP